VAFSFALLKFFTDNYPHDPQTFRGFFRATIQRYVDLPGVMKAALEDRHHKLFQNAVMDFINRQPLDYRGSFTCPNGARHLIFDALTLSIQRGKLGLYYSWEPDADGEAPHIVPKHMLALDSTLPILLRFSLCRCAALTWPAWDTLPVPSPPLLPAAPADPLVAGSLFKERVMVADPAMRKQLRLLASSQGLEQQSYEALVAQLAAADGKHFLVVLADFLREVAVEQAGNLFLPMPFRWLLLGIASTAPASTLLKPEVWPLIEQIAGEGASSSSMLLMGAVNC
jgi:hypothetical protein